MNLESRIQTELEQLNQINRLRELKNSENLIDFSSNDYLGFVTSSDNLFSSTKQKGSTGSRLITGNTTEIECLEKEMALFFKSEAALLFNSGYLANLGIITTLAKRNDIIIYDQFVHASLRDGIQLSKSKNYSFEHNNLIELEKKLIVASENKITNSEIFVVIESVYSMDGDSPDLTTMVLLCQKYQAHIILDEAHGLGTTGIKGEGLAQHIGLENSIFARIFTFGKALGCEGAVVIGSQNLRKYLINFCRTFIYSTAPSPLKIESIKYQWNKLITRQDVNLNAQLLKTHLINQLAPTISIKTGQYGNIVMILVAGNEQAKRVALDLKSKGMDVRPILSPTVPVGHERLRICLHEFNTLDQIEQLATALNNTINRSL